MGLVFKLVVVVLIVDIAWTNSIGKAPTVSLTPKNIKGVEKGMVYMLCNTTGIPRPNITLYKNGVKILNSRVYKFKIAHGWFIRIGPLKQRHQGTYRCEAANGVGPVVSDSSAILRVYQMQSIPSGFPRIGRNPRPQFKRSGDKVVFQCTVTGTPKPSIMWLQNKVPLKLPKNRFSVSANGDLTIVNLEKKDKGSYACVAENSKGTVITRDARLFVREVRRPPRFVVRPLGQTVNPDSDVILNCSAVGYPKPALVWERDGSRISGGADGFLAIKRIQRSGNYTCIAVSFLGRVKAYAFVKVKLLPFAPTRPTATGVSPNSITITWQSSGSHVVTSFVIEHKLKSETLWKSTSIRGTMTLKVPNLQPYSNYQFRVFAVNSLGRSGSSPIAEYTTSQSKPSSAPINITAKGVSDTSFRADWLPPLSPNGPIRGYRVYYSLDQKGAFSQGRYMASATNHATITGLTKQTTYFFKIAAYNMAGMGPPSQVMAVKTQKGVPGQPKVVRLLVLSSTSMQISWQKPQDPGDGIFGYEVFYNKSSADMDTTVGASVGQDKIIMGLTPYTVYKFGVAAKSDKGIGPMSFAVTARTKEDVPSGSPLNIIGKSKDSTTLEIKWDPPLPLHRNGIITDYTIKYKTKGGRAKYMKVDGIKTSVVLHNLKKFTKYFVWVSASTKQGEGPMSSKHVFSTAEDVPSGAPTRLKASVLNSSSIEVSWSPPTSAQQDGKILGYMVIYVKVDDLGNQLKPPAPVEMKDSESENNLKVYLTNLAPETTYQIEVAGYTIKGDGARSLTRLAKTLPRLPDAPFVFTQKSPGRPSVVILGWRTSASDVINYKIRYGKSLIRLRGRDQSKLQLKEEPLLSKTTTTQTFQSLGRGIWYLFNVSLRTKAGWSPETAKWVQIPPGPPTGPPLNVRARASSSTHIKVAWSPPDVWKSGGGINKYVIMFNPDGQSNISRKTVHGENNTKVTLKKLMKYTTYEIRVKAVNSYGEGPLSGVEYETTQEDTPGRPWNVVLKAQSSSVLSVQWQEPRNPNGNIKKYQVIYTDNPSTDEKTWQRIESSETSASLRSLKRDEKYWVRVAAFTSKGMGDYSKGATVRTLKFDLPRPCRNFKLRQLGSDSIVIEWLPPEIDAGIITYKVSYSGSKSYKERGETIPLTDARDISIPAVNNKQQSYKIENLIPYMDYKLRISAMNAMGEGREVELNCKTSKEKPSRLPKPEVIFEEVNEGFIPVKLSKASERNGPISHYLIVVVPLGNEKALPEDDPDNYFKRVKRRLRRASNTLAPYIAAKFMANQLPERFHVGEESSGNQFGYINKRLTKGSYYTVFSRAYVEKENKELVYKSSPFTEPVSAASPQTQMQSEAERKGKTITLIIILVVVFIVLIAVAALAVLCFMKRRRRRKEKKYKEEEKSEPSDPVELRRLNFQTPAMIDHPPIPVGDLAKHISFLKAENNSKFSHEYESIEPGQTFTTEASTAEMNRHKNRYPNILAYDHTRVRLSNTDGYQDLDYINANFCDGYRKENAYIATQGPLPNTAADFWRMIWEQRTFTIVMLTREEERGRVKCEQYWPNEGTITYDEIEVSLVDWVELANYTITTLQISMEGESQPREVKHFQFTGWPDHGVPPHPTPFLAFLRRVKFYNPPDAGPIAVHCSAGVGRTAIFIVIDSMLERIKHEYTVDIYGHVTVLRTQRNYMVQTLEQYIFVHDALLEAVSAGNTEVHARNLLQHIKKLTELGKGEVTGLEEEFKKLIDPIQARRHKHGAATLAINRPKNRMANILPYESTRVHISPVRGVEGSDYINASFIDGYRQRAAFIATQGPLKDTVDDFWRMLMEQNSNIVVMMTQLHEGEWEKCYKYWPTERSARHQYYIVDPVNEQEFAQFVMRDFKVKDARNDTVRNIKQFHFTGWPEIGVPKSGEAIIDLIGQVQRVYEQQEEDGPVTVHCSDGVGRTGVFCALFVVLERMRSEGVVDLFQTVKLLRTQRPAMVQSQEQYLFCYKTALEYLGSFDHYAT